MHKHVVRVDSEFYAWRNAKGPKVINAQIVQKNINSVGWHNIRHVPHAQVLTHQQYVLWSLIIQSVVDENEEGAGHYYSRIPL